MARKKGCKRRRSDFHVRVSMGYQDWIPERYCLQSQRRM